jgi:hypothetical protein
MTWRHSCAARSRCDARSAFTPKGASGREAVVEFGGEIRFDQNITEGVTDGTTPMATLCHEAGWIDWVAPGRCPFRPRRISSRAESVDLGPASDARGWLEGEEHPLGAGGEQ